MPSGALLGGHRCPDPKDGYLAVDAGAVEQRHGDAGESVMSGIAVAAAEEAGGTRSITPGSRLGEHLVDLLRVARQPVLWLIRFAQPLQNVLPLPVRTKRQ